MDVALNTASTLPFTIEPNGKNEVQLAPDVWLMIFELLDAKSILRLRRVRMPVAYSTDRVLTDFVLVHIAVE